jgi:hypothetical protein
MARAGAAFLAVAAAAALAACPSAFPVPVPPSGDVSPELAAELEIPAPPGDPGPVPAWPACLRSDECHRGETCTSSTCGAPTTPPGPLAADFTLQDLNPNSATDGKPVTLSAQAGHVVVLYFAWSS